MWKLLNYNLELLCVRANSMEGRLAGHHHEEELFEVLAGWNRAMLGIDSICQAGIGGL